MGGILSAVLCLVLVSSGPVEHGTHLGDQLVTITHDGLERTYILHVPPEVGKEPAPLVIFYHGGTGTARHAARAYGFNELADREGFIVAYPNGTGRLQTWNATHCCGEARRNNVDDVGFTRAMIEDIKGRVKVDQKRIYATGMSNGAMMCYRLGSEMSDTFAAIAPVAGVIGGKANRWTPERRPQRPEHPVAVIAFNGQADGNVPYDGGHPPNGLTRQRSDISVADSIRFWVEANGCAPEPTRQVSESGNIITETYNDPDGVADVVLVTIVDGGHAWPGSQRPRRRADQPTPEISATQMIWTFFEAHPKP